MALLNQEIILNPSLEVQIIVGQIMRTFILSRSQWENNY